MGRNEEKSEIQEIKIQNFSKKNSDSDGWKFENENVAKMWLRRKKRFKPKKKINNARSRLKMFNKMKQKTKSFGGSNRFKKKKRIKPIKNQSQNMYNLDAHKMDNV